MDSETKTWAMILHLSVLTGYAVPILGLLVPIIIWQIKKDQLPEIDAHGKMVVNFLISMFIYSVISFLLLFVVVGAFLLGILGIIGLIFPIIGGLKANNGELWDYPLMLKLIR